MLLLAPRVDLFARACRAELSVVIDEDKVTVLDVDNHVGFAIPVHILEGESHHRQVLPRTNQGWTDVDLGFGSITPREDGAAHCHEEEWILLGPDPRQVLRVGTGAVVGAQEMEHCDVEGQGSAAVRSVFPLL